MQRLLPWLGRPGLLAPGPRRRWYPGYRWTGLAGTARPRVAVRAVPVIGRRAFWLAVPFPGMPRWFAAAAAAAAAGSPVGVPAPRFRLGEPPPCARAGSPACAFGGLLRDGLGDVLIHFVLDRKTCRLGRDQAGDPVQDLGEPPDRLRVPGAEQVEVALGPVVNSSGARGRLIQRLLGLCLGTRQDVVGLLCAPPR